MASFLGADYSSQHDETYPCPPLSEEGVHTGNIVYRINRAHGLQCVGKEEEPLGRWHAGGVPARSLTLPVLTSFRLVQLDIQLPYIQRIVFDELAAGFN